MNSSEGSSVTVIKFAGSKGSSGSGGGNPYYTSSAAGVSFSRPTTAPPPPPFSSAVGETMLKPRGTFGAGSAASGSMRSADERAREKAREADGQSVYETYEQFPVVVGQTSALFAPQPSAPEAPDQPPPTYTNMLNSQMQPTSYVCLQPTSVLQKGKKKQWEQVFQIEKKRFRLKGDSKHTLDVAGLCEGSGPSEILVADVGSGNVKRYNCETQTVDVVFVGHGEIAGLFRLANSPPTAAVSAAASTSPTHAVIERVASAQPELVGVELVLCAERTGTRNLVETARLRMPEMLNVAAQSSSSSLVQLADGDLLVAYGSQILFHARRNSRGDYEAVVLETIKFDSPILGVCLLDKPNSNQNKADGSISHDMAISFESRNLVVCNARKDKRTRTLQWKVVFKATFDPSAKRPFRPDLMLFDERSETLLVHNHSGETSVELFRVLYNETLQSFEVRRLAHAGRLPQPRDFNARCWALSTCYPIPSDALQKKGIAASGKLDAIVLFDKKQLVVKFFIFYSEELMSTS